MSRIILGLCMPSLLLTSLGHTAAYGHDIGRGSIVIAVRPDVAAYSAASEEAPRVSLSIVGYLFTVQDERRDWLEVAGVEGRWVKRSDVVPLERAVEYFSAAIAESPSAYFYAARSRAYLAGSNDLQHAVTDAEAAIRLDPGCALAFACKAGCREKQGHFKNAIADYSRAIALDPTLASAHYSCARAHRRW